MFCNFRPPTLGEALIIMAVWRWLASTRLRAANALTRSISRTGTGGPATSEVALRQAGSERRASATRKHTTMAFSMQRQHSGSLGGAGEHAPATLTASSPSDLSTTTPDATEQPSKRASQYVVFDENWNEIREDMMSSEQSASRPGSVGADPPAAASNPPAASTVAKRQSQYVVYDDNWNEVAADTIAAMSPHPRDALPLGGVELQIVDESQGKARAPKADADQASRRAVNSRPSLSDLIA